MEVGRAVEARDRTEVISRQGKTLCMIIRAESSVNATTFYTPSDFNLQVGKIVGRAGSEIPRHAHRPTGRKIIGTSEVLVVQKGLMVLDVYDEGHAFCCSRQMRAGDVVVLVAGGHGFKFLEDTVLLEVKQGPYGGDR